MNVGGGTLELVGVDGQLVTGSHGLGDTCGGLYGKDLLLVPSLELCYLTLLLPILDKSRARLGLHIESRHSDEVIGANLNGCALAALKGEVKVKSVVNLGGGDIGGLAVYASDLLGNELKHLVDEVNAPVEDHTAAGSLVASPVGGNTSRAVDSRLDIDNLADLTRVNEALDSKEVNVPASVLVNRELAAVLLCRLYHLVELADRESNGLLADNVLACVQSSYNYILVYVVGGSAENDVNLGICDELLKRCVDVNAVFLCRVHSLLGDVIDSRESNNVALICPVSVPGALTAVTNDS